MRGIIIGSAGRGRGLDDPDFEPIWKAAADAGLFVFIHPHYGIGHGLFPDTGHAMMLALGFTFETSIAVSLLILRGVLERHPALKLLIAHAGGTLPYLAGRLTILREERHLQGLRPAQAAQPLPAPVLVRFDRLSRAGAGRARRPSPIRPRSCSARIIRSSARTSADDVLDNDDLAGARGEPAGAVVARRGHGRRRSPTRTVWLRSGLPPDHGHAASNGHLTSVLSGHRLMTHAMRMVSCTAEPGVDAVAAGGAGGRACRFAAGARRRCLAQRDRRQIQAAARGRCGRRHAS